MRKSKILIAIFLSVFISCAPRYSPLVPELKEVPSNPYGSFIEIELVNGNIVSGELIAVSNDTVFVYGFANFEILDIREIKSAKVIIYRKHNILGYIIWGLVGTLSTVTHGWGAYITAPAWILGTMIAVIIKSSEENEINYPDISLTYLARFSRYPQGLPPDLKKKILEEGKLR